MLKTCDALLHKSMCTYGHGSDQRDLDTKRRLILSSHDLLTSRYFIHGLDLLFCPRISIMNKELNKIYFSLKKKRMSAPIHT